MEAIQTELFNNGNKQINLIFIFYFVLLTLRVHNKNTISSSSQNVFLYILDNVYRKFIFIFFSHIFLIIYIESLFSFFFFLFITYIGNKTIDPSHYIFICIFSSVIQVTLSLKKKKLHHSHKFQMMAKFNILTLRWQS